MAGPSGSRPILTAEDIIKAPASPLQMITNVLKTSDALTVTEINLSGTGFSDLDAHTLSDLLDRNTALVSLHLGHNSLTAIGLRLISEKLKTKEHFAILNLACNKIGDEGAEMVSRLIRVREMTHVNLGENSITVEGMRHLGEAIKMSKTLVSLNIECNHIGLEGLNILAEAVKGCPSITSVHAIGNHAGVEGSAILAQIDAVCTKNAAKKEKKKGKAKPKK